MCNSLDRASLEPRIDGCTALIDSGQGTPVALAIAYNNRGNAYATKGDYDRAIQDFDHSIKLNPTSAKPFNNRGIAYLKKGEYDLAIEALDEAIKLNPNYGEAFANRAGIYLKKNEYDRAARDYDEAIRLEPSLEAVWNGRCWTRAILGALQAALEDCNKALQLKPNDGATYDSRGLIYLKMGQLDAAIDDYNSALRFEPEAGERALWTRACQAQKGRQGWRAIRISQRQRQSRPRSAMISCTTACNRDCRAFTATSKFDAPHSAFRLTPAFPNRGIAGARHVFPAWAFAGTTRSHRQHVIVDLVATTFVDFPGPP